jgi:hypothetical protein
VAAPWRVPVPRGASRGVVFLLHVTLECWSAGGGRPAGRWGWSRCGLRALAAVEAAGLGRGGGEGRRSGAEARRSGLGFRRDVEVAAGARGRRGSKGRVGAAGVVGGRPVGGEVTTGRGRWWRPEAGSVGAVRM